MKEKGIEEFLYAARVIHKEYPETLFKIVGNCEEDYKTVMEEYEKKGILELTGYEKNILPYYQEADAVVMPSYHEGMSNVILEASANGRPVLASRIPGCMEGFEDGRTGFGFSPGDGDALVEAIRKFIELPREEREQMGKNARNKMEKEFDRKYVVAAYMEEIRKCGKRGQG
ncbi:MAG: glycosyltransferase [Roseburia sp.]|nr:glycosyltransferase [Roseburia sp.]